MQNLASFRLHKDDGIKIRWMAVWKKKWWKEHKKCLKTVRCTCWTNFNLVLRESWPPSLFQTQRRSVLNHHLHTAYKAHQCMSQYHISKVKTMHLQHQYLVTYLKAEISDDQTSFQFDLLYACSLCRTFGFCWFMLWFLFIFWICMNSSDSF